MTYVKAKGGECVLLLPFPYLLGLPALADTLAEEMGGGGGQGIWHCINVPLAVSDVMVSG